MRRRRFGSQIFLVEQSNPHRHHQAGTIHLRMISKAVPSFHSEVIVIGAGVIGLAVTRALAKAGKEVVLLEKNSTIGAETSSRNSEVIHAVRCLVSTELRIAALLFATLVCNEIGRKPINFYSDASYQTDMTHSCTPKWISPDVIFFP